MFAVSTLLLAALSGQAPPIRTGADVVRAMRAKYPTFSKFQPLAGGWIGTEVLFVRGGKEYLREIYRDWKVNDALTEELFESRAWKRAGWIPR